MTTINKGPVHPNFQFLDKSFSVEYVGRIRVLTSMKLLDFSSRSVIAKECIFRVTRNDSSKQSDESSCDAQFKSILANDIEMKQLQIELRIDKEHLSLIEHKTLDVIEKQKLKCISFACGGRSSDAESKSEQNIVRYANSANDSTSNDIPQNDLDYIAYVYKSDDECRFCYVFHCPQSPDSFILSCPSPKLTLAQMVIDAIASAFQLRYSETCKEGRSENAHSHIQNERGKDEYYNDMPDKIPPAESCAIVKDDLIDLNSDLQISKRGINHNGVSVNTHGKDRKFTHNTLPTSSHKKDAFDMSPFDKVSSNTLLPGKAGRQRNETAPDASRFYFPSSEIWNSVIKSTTNLSSNGTLRNKNNNNQNVVDFQVWFHGSIPRVQAENLLKKEGEFLVREVTKSSNCSPPVVMSNGGVSDSSKSVRQFVLSGVVRGGRDEIQHKHLLLVDGKGVVRTADRSFDSISHLICYHMENCLPIISDVSAVDMGSRSATQNSSLLYLMKPVPVGIKL